MKQLGPLQQDYFRKLSPSQRREALRAEERELGNALGLPESPARDHKVEELKARIAYLRGLP